MKNSESNTDRVVEAAFSVISSYQNKQKTRKNAWIAGTFAGILAICALGLVFLKLYQGSRKAARIAHERDMLIEKENQDKVDTQVAQNNSSIHEAVSISNQHGQAIRSLNAKLDEIRLEQDRNRRTIDALKSWEDVDIYLARKK